MNDIFKLFDMSDIIKYRDFETNIVLEYTKLLFNFCHYCCNSVYDSDRYYACLGLNMNTEVLYVTVPEELKRVYIQEISVCIDKHRYIVKIVYENNVLMLDPCTIIKAYRDFLGSKEVKKSYNVFVNTVLTDKYVDAFKYLTYKCLRYPRLNMSKNTKILLDNTDFLMYSRTQASSVYYIENNVWANGSCSDIRLQTNDIYGITAKSEYSLLLNHSGYFLVYIYDTNYLYFTEITGKDSNILFFLDLDKDVLIHSLESIIAEEEINMLGMLNIVIPLDLNDYSAKDYCKIQELLGILKQKYVDIRFCGANKGIE